jgi:hypothetical protein
MGSTNYGKLTNVSIIPEASDSAVTGVTGSVTNLSTSGQDYPQKFEFVCTAVDNNIVRVAGGKHRVPSTVGCCKSCNMTFADKQCNMLPTNKVISLYTTC